MDGSHFDALTRTLDLRSRRGALRSLGALGLFGLVDRLVIPSAEAKKKKGEKKGGNKDKKGDKDPECPTCTCPTSDSCPGNTLPCDGECVSRERICGNHCCRAETYCIDALGEFCDCHPGNYECGGFCCPQGQVCGEGTCSTCKVGDHVCAEGGQHVICGSFNNKSCWCVTSVDGVAGCWYNGANPAYTCTPCTTDADCANFLGSPGVCIDVTGNCSSGCPPNNRTCIHLGCPAFA